MRDFGAKVRSVFLGEAQVQRAIRVMVHASLRVSVCATRVGEEPRRRKRRASLRARPRPGEDGTGKKKREGRTCRRAEGNSRGVARRHAALRAGSRGGTGVGRRGWGKCWMENTYLNKLSARERGMARRCFRLKPCLLVPERHLRAQSLNSSAGLLRAIPWGKGRSETTHPASTFACARPEHAGCGRERTEARR